MYMPTGICYCQNEQWCLGRCAAIEMFQSSFEFASYRKTYPFLVLEMLPKYLQLGHLSRADNLTCNAGTSTLSIRNLQKESSSPFLYGVPAMLTHAVALLLVDNSLYGYGIRKSCLTVVSRREINSRR